MASWSKPLQLLKRNDDNNKLEINQEAIDLIGKIDKDLSIISTVGNYRGGKSYLLNRIAKLLGIKLQPGFEVDSTIGGVTKGIQVVYLDNPCDEHKGFLLLDTEGLGDPEGDNENFDCRILCLSILLSSCFLYNHKGEIDSSAIKKLKIVSHVTNKINLKNVEQKLNYLASCFPTFTLVVRDFQSDLPPNTTENEYMERKVFSLPKKVDEKKAISTFTFRNCFLQRNCILLPTPAETRFIKNINEVDDIILLEEFKQAFAKLFDYVISKGPTKVVNQVDVVNGERFALLTENYVQQVNAVEEFNIETAIGEVAMSQNESAINCSIEEYVNSMYNLKLEGASLTAILNAHVDCSKRAVQTFVKKCMETKADTYFKYFEQNLRIAYVGNLKQFLTSNSALKEPEANTNEELEILRANLVKKFQDLSMDNIVSVDEVFKLLNQSVTHKNIFYKSIEEHINHFNEWLEECKRIKKEANAKLLRQKEEELKRLKREGYENTELFIQLTKDVALLGVGVAAGVACVPLSTAATIGLVGSGTLAAAVCVPVAAVATVGLVATGVFFGVKYIGKKFGL